LIGIILGPGSWKYKKRGFAVVFFSINFCVFQKTGAQNNVKIHFMDYFLILFEGIGMVCMTNAWTLIFVEGEASSSCYTFSSLV